MGKWTLREGVPSLGLFFRLLVGFWYVVLVVLVFDVLGLWFLAAFIRISGFADLRGAEFKVLGRRLEVLSCAIFGSRGLDMLAGCNPMKP